MNKLTEQDGKSLDKVNENLEALKAECFSNKQESRVDLSRFLQVGLSAVKPNKQRNPCSSLPKMIPGFLGVFATWCEIKRC